MSDARLIRGQVEYYRARAGEYDQWFFRQGRYDRGSEHRAAWFSEITSVELALAGELRAHDVLELACGTGLWTRHLAGAGRSVVAIDASAEVIAINRLRVASPGVHYVVGDVFSPPVAGLFDLVFFSFWLSHVPPARFEAFWATVRHHLRPGGRVFFLDSLLDQDSTATDHGQLSTSGVVRRKLNDGRTFDVVKVFYDPADLERRLRDLGWSGWIRSSGRFFLYGSLTPGSRDHVAGPSESSISRG